MVVWLKRLRDVLMFGTGAWWVFESLPSDPLLLLLGLCMISMPLWIPPTTRPLRKGRAPMALRNDPAKAPVTPAAEDPDTAMAASEPATWCTCGSTAESVPVEVTYVADADPVTVAYLCPSCRERRKPTLDRVAASLRAQGHDAKVVRGPIPWGTPGQFTAAQDRLRELISMLQQEQLSLTATGVSSAAAEAATHRARLLRDEIRAIKTEIDWREGIAAAASGAADPLPPTEIVQGHWVYMVGWHAEDDLCDEDQHRWEDVPGGQLCLTCEVRRRRLVTDHQYEDEASQVHAAGSTAAVRTFHWCGSCGRPPEDHAETKPILQGEPGLTKGGTVVSLHGGRSDGRKVRLLDTPPTIRVFAEVYEQITDPDTGEFLGGYALANQPVRWDMTSDGWIMPSTGVSTQRAARNLLRNLYGEQNRPG